VILVTQETFDAVYRLADETTETLPPGNYVRLVNAEMITGLLNPVFVVALTPVVVWFFGMLAMRGRQIPTARKIFYGMVITTISLLVMAFGAYLGQDGAIKTSMMWLVIYYLIITCGELCLSPMGLSLVTKLSPKRLVGLMMGGWFLFVSIGNKLSGFISGLEPSTMMFLILAAAILGVAGFIYVLLPGAFLLFYRSPSVAETCQARDPSPQWTDGCPPRLLTLMNEGRSRGRKMYILLRETKKSPALEVNSLVVGW